MSVRIGDTAPNFTAPTTQGDIDFHDWLGDSWGVLFSHPKISLPSARQNSEPSLASSQNSTDEM